MRLTVDPTLSEPPYRQLQEQVQQQVDDATLAPGTRLPPVRELAAELGLAANTVARAYRELEQAGVIETRGRAGSFVAGSGVERAAREAATVYVERVIALGLDPDAALRLVAERLSR